MISWIQNHLIRHGRWIFVTLLAVVIVAFVFTIGNTPGCTSDQSAYTPREFYGYDLNSPRDMQAIGGKVSLSAMLNRSRAPQNDQQFQSQATSRIALLHLADEIGIPGPDEETLKEYITTKGAFNGPDGSFSPDAYTKFIDSIESNPQIKDGLVIIVLEEDYRMEQLSSILSGPGYLLPSEAIAQTQRNETTFDLATASLDFTSFEPDVEPTEDDLKEFFKENDTRYEIPERVEATYILFPSAQYETSAGEATEAELREHFISNRARFVADFETANPKPESENTEDKGVEEPVIGFEQVRDAVVKELNAQKAKRAANEAAQTFVETLYLKEIPKGSEPFNQLLDERKLSLKEIAPYTSEGAANSRLSSKMLESGFTLGGHRYYSDPYPLNDGFGVLIHNGRIQPEIPPYDAVAAEVAEDYKAEEKRRLFNEKGANLKTELESKIAEGMDFVEAAEALELKVQSHEPFLPAEAPRELPRSALQSAQGMQNGEISPMLTLQEKGTFVYLKSKTVPEISADNENFTQTQDSLKRYASFISSSSHVNELIRTETPATLNEGE